MGSGFTVAALPRNYTVIHQVFNNIYCDIIYVKWKKKRGDYKMTKKELKKYSEILMKGAFVAVFLSMVGYFGYDLWLASTQWLLVSSVMALFGVYLKLS